MNTIVKHVLKVGLGVVPKSLFDSIYLSEDEEEDCVLIDES